jgi:ADP-ribose pyrophosphatase
MAHTRSTLLETRRFTVTEEVVPRPDGSTASCVFVEHPGAVAVLAMVDDQRVCLIHSRRLTVEQTLVEVPAGTREPNEPPLESARRELQEETGYRAEHWEKLGEFYTSPGILTERMHLYLATGLTAGPPQREPNEEIENLVVTWDEAMAMLDRGEIVDGKTLVALLAYDRRRRGAS